MTSPDPVFDAAVYGIVFALVILAWAMLSARNERRERRQIAALLRPTRPTDVTCRFCGTALASEDAILLGRDSYACPAWLPCDGPPSLPKE